MTYYMFADLFLKNHFVQTFVIYLIMNLLFFYIYRKFILSIFDPMFLSISMAQASCATVIVLLLLYKYVSFFSFIFLLFLFFIYLIGLNIPKKHISINRYSIKKESKSHFLIFYYLHTFMFVSIALFYISKIDFKNAFQNKLETRSMFNGIFLGLQEVFTIGEFIVIQMKQKIFNKKSFLDIFLYLLLFLSCLSMGSKSAIVSSIGNILVISICINIYKSRTIPVFNIFSRKNVLLVLLSFVSVVILFLVTYDNPSSAFEKFCGILLQGGDIYYYTLPYDNYKIIPQQPVFNHFFYSFFAPLRKFLPLKQNSSLGFDIVSYVYQTSNPTFGPNSRTFVILLMSRNFILAGIIIFVVGFLISYIRRMNFFRNSFYGVYFSIYILLISPRILSDLPLFGLAFMPVVLIIPLLYIVAYILYQAARTDLKNEIKN